MFHCDRKYRRGLSVVLLVVSLLSTWVISPWTPAQAQVQRRKTAAAQVSGSVAAKPGLTRQQRMREMWVWHEANRQRLAQSHPLGLSALTTDIINQDTNDVSVIQGDGRLITLPALFNLNGQAVQFTPSGAGYTITTGSAAYDTNLGTKLNLRLSPAVNPKSGTDPGDDAYILQDLGFNFSFYGASYSSVAVSSNGNLTFRPAGVSQNDFDQGTVSSGETLAELQSGLPRIAPYWHDLDATASATTGTNGIYLRRDSDRVVISWNNIRDFPNDATVDTGLHRFQVTLFNNGRITFTYASAQLTSKVLVGISGGLSSPTPTLVTYTSPPAGSITTPIAQVFSTLTRVDEIGALQAFYAAHPGRDVYDFVYVMTDFDFDLGDAFAFFEPIRNSVQGIGDPSGSGSPIFDNDPGGAFLGSQKVQGLLDLSNINTIGGLYPESPTQRITTASGANHALSIMGQEQGHRWMSYVTYPGTSTLLLGRDDAHWSFWLNMESTISGPGARRASSMEGNVWRDNGNGTFTSTGLNDGYTRLDHYLMGLRPASDIADTFVITSPTSTGGRTRMDDTEAAVTVGGTKLAISASQVVQANGTRTPDSTTAQKNFRAAVVLLVKQGTQPSAQTMNKLTRYRLAWESYFAQSTDFLATINTGLADSTTPRLIAATSAASFDPTLSPGEIGAIFGQGLTNTTAVATTQPLPTTLAGVQVFIDGVAAPLFFAAPTQINFQVPRTTTATTPVFGVQSATALIEIVSNGQLIRAGAFQLGPAVPAIFTANASGTGAAAAVDAFTGAAGPFNAKRADGTPNIISVFGTGMGADATDVDGDVKATVQATIDGVSVTVNYAGRAPGFTGLNQLNITLPAGIAAGTHTLVVSRNGIPSRPVTIATK